MVEVFGGKGCDCIRRRLLLDLRNLVRSLFHVL